MIPTIDDPSTLQIYLIFSSDKTKQNFLTERRLQKQLQHKNEPDSSSWGGNSSFIALTAV